jgi:hypothetical protein
MPEGRSQSPPARPPSCSCIILCDDLVVSHVNGQKHTLQGVIGGVRVPEFPAALGPYMCYIRLANLINKEDIEVSFEYADTNETIFSVRVPLPPQEHPLGVCTLVLNIPQFGLEKPGRYLLSAKHNGFAVAESPIVVQTSSGSA